MGRKRETMEQVAERVLDTRLKGLLEDVRYRISVLEETKAGIGIHSHDLNLASHMMDGYVFTNNSPSAGSVAWTDVNIVYKGVKYVITNGSTAKKYLWWDFDASPNTVLQSSDTKPTITSDDILIGVNDGGAFALTMAPGKPVPGSTILDGTVGSGELGSSAVTSDKIAALAVVAGKIAGSAIDSTKLADNAVTMAKITDGAVTGTKIGSKAVGSSNLADGAVGSTQLANNAVTSGKLVDGAVTGVKIGAGSVAEDKLNVATHFLF